MKKLKITKLTPSYEKIVELYKKERNTRLKERYHTILLMHELKNCTEVATLLKRDRSTIQNWTNTFNNGGLEALKPKKGLGKAPRLSEEQMDELTLDILKHPRELGYDFSNWEGKNVSYHLQEKYGVSLGVRACQLLLHRLGFSLQRPRYTFPHANLEKQEAFRETLKKKWMHSTETT
ncbi:MAG: transposase [Promethearchaeota archaeon]